MVTIKINGIPVTAPEKSRLIEVIRGEGIDVPSLCYLKEMEHYTSCMACMVRDNDTGKFIPSCSAVVRDGMNIDASGTEVMQMRTEAIRLLLVEHRAECEAPCKLVCPLKLDIPLMNRLLTEGKVAEATALTFSTLGDPVAVCTACPGFCDKGCRRKKIDTNISIKNTVIYLASAHQKKSEKQGAQSSGLRAQESNYGIKHFNSMLGSVTDDEWQQWVLESRSGAASHTNPATVEQACEEASRCMHCDCRAAANCRLRDVATTLQLKNPRGKRTAFPITKKINNKSGLIFEHAKCIKCGLCVRLGATLTQQPSLCFRGRGYETIISEPLYHEFVDIINDAASQFADICPTGALALLNKTK